ncbi:MAG: ParA family protein [Succinivibrionaceae bacterium]|nr:ParA family protein [Ruminobacter sp.]MDY5778396.1 ParA family protein [Succinivibrionaceae bacterium]MEE1341083.1 ParA family protein [Succinivibrionaceae bacterium]
MIVWTVANQKGGVGKTTTVITLAGLLSTQGKRVLLLDTDPHASLTSCFGYDSDELETTLFDLFIDREKSLEEIKKLIIPTDVKNISLMAGSIALATLDKSLGSEDGVGLLLDRALKLLENDFDVAIIDCPPVLGVMMVNALAASSRIIVPTQTEFLALKGLERMMKTFEILRGTKSKPLDYIVVPTMFDKRTRASHESLDSITQNYRDVMWGDVIPVDTRFRDASQQHIPANILFPESRGVKAYQMLLADLLMFEGAK